VFRELAASEEANLKVALQKHNDRLCYLHLADAGFGLDIDRPADYQEALKLYFHKT
jgi:CTP:molybdopterin cytidylyltransferase MocA